MKKVLENAPNFYIFMAKRNFRMITLHILIKHFKIVTSTFHSDSVKIITHGSLSTDCTMEFKNVSVAAVRLFMAASILVFTSGCLRACSGSTSYGNLLNNTVKLIYTAVVSLYSVSHCLKSFQPAYYHNQHLG